MRKCPWAIPIKQSSRQVAEYHTYSVKQVVSLEFFSFSFVVPSELYAASIGNLGSTLSLCCKLCTNQTLASFYQRYFCYIIPRFYVEFDMHVFTNLYAWAGYDTRSIFKRIFLLLDQFPYQAKRTQFAQL